MGQDVIYTCTTSIKTFKSAKILSKIKGIEEFNIGHFLIGESIFVGMNNTIRSFKKILKK